MRAHLWTIVVFAGVILTGWGQTTVDDPTVASTVAGMDPLQLQNFEGESFAVQKVLKEALALTRMNLKYKYGSADPMNGGLDCSGTVYYVLKKVGISDVPRQASQMYLWVRKSGAFRAVWSSDLKTFELNELQPGDLLFWTGTYDVDRDPPITHVMIYAGINKSTGKRVMIGSSEGRQYDGKSRYGTSVFDFGLPGYPLPKWASQGRGRFIGYGKIPGLETLNPPLPPATMVPQ